MAAMTKAPSLKPVQEILRSGVVPENYIRSKEDDGYEAGDEISLPMTDDLKIDYSSLLSSSAEELTKLRSALSSWGCAQLVNHDMPSSLLEEVRNMSKQFFKLPQEEKDKYSSKGDSLEGYGNDNAIREGSFNWNDKLHLQVYPFHKRQLDFWPEEPQNFRRTLHEYTNKTMILIETVLKAMASSLDLEENSFFELWGKDEDDMMHARFNFYPRYPKSDQVIGLKPHGDGTAITILLQDKEVEGLRVLKDDHWFRVPIIPDALVIHIGDQMEIASNGIFKSPTHKVVVNPTYDRFSLAMLPLPNPGKEIGPLKELITEERPQLYKRITNYGQLYFKYISTGKRQINLMKINY